MPVEFKEAARWSCRQPKESDHYYEEKCLGPLQELATAVDPERIRFPHCPFAIAIADGMGLGILPTDIIVFADDDAIWPSYHVCSYMVRML